MNYGLGQVSEISLKKQLAKSNYCPFRIELARRDFWEYRKLMNPKMKQGWFQEKAARALQKFLGDLIAGLRPILIMQAPPQHGKSVLVIDFITWAHGKYPWFQTIFASFSERLGVRANLRMRRIMGGELYNLIFPGLRLPTRKDSDYSLTKTLIEFPGQEGYFRNTTVEGSVTGETLSLGVIDDPVKGRKEANSETVRESTWEWFTDDFYTRFAEEGGLLMVLTRWHIDDPAGRLIDLKLPNTTVLKFTAIAMEDEEHRKKGEALFPEHKSLEFLLRRKMVLGIENFEALYQQSPIIIGGDIFKEEYFQYYDSYRRYRRIIQSWDTAQKANEFNDPSVCTTWGEHEYGYDLLDVLCERLTYPKLKRTAIRMAQTWGGKKTLYQGHILFSILIEDKGSGISLIQDMRESTTFNIEAIEPCGDKVTRAHVITPQFEAAKVHFLRNAPWLQDYKTELLSFPNGLHDDQVDSTTQFLSCISAPASGTITDELIPGDPDTWRPDNPW